MAVVQPYELLMAPPRPAGKVPEIALGTVRLFRDLSWSGDFVDIDVSKQAPRTRHSLIDTFNDQASWVAYNLAPNTVLTLMQHDAPLAAGQNPADLSFCGLCVDLVGTGFARGVDLGGVNMNDMVSAYMWREVDLNAGVVQFFEGAHFGGNQTSIFLGDWPAGTIHDIENWWLNDRISSMNWACLSGASVRFFEHGNGGGAALGPIAGMGNPPPLDRSATQYTDLGAQGFNDIISSFSWQRG